MTMEMKLIDVNSYGSRLASWKMDCVGHDDWETASVIDDCLCELYAQPTIDAVPVVHGRWELGKDKKPYCTACGKRALMDCTHEPEVGYGLYYYKKSEICPNCGAKMDGGVEDGK